jgi:DNA-binding NtrC family response regulator
VNAEPIEALDPAREDKILLVDDVAVNLRTLRAIFENAGFITVEASGGEEAIARCTEEPPSVVLLDLRMPKMDGLETLARLKAIAPNLPVVMLTGDRDIAAAVQATKLGADNFLIRPLKTEQLLLTIRHAMERRKLRDQVDTLRHFVGYGNHLAKLLLPSLAMHRVVDAVRKVAPSNFTVLILGETGSGKEVVARAIYHESSRSDKPFVPLDCGAIPETLMESELFGYEKGAFSGADRRKSGYFQLAQGGTLFLDEVSSLSLAAQPKLLRAIQERHVNPLGATRSIAVDVRILAATNVRLQDKVQRGEFREDLYYRLAEYTISIPPLRERPEDILKLAAAFLEEASLELRRSVSGISDAATRPLLEYSWPGNVRELRNVIRQATLQCGGGLIQPEDLAPYMNPDAPAIAEQPIEVSGRSLKEITAIALENAEKHAILAALNSANGNKSQAARILRTDYKTLFNKIRKYKI